MAVNQRHIQWANLGLAVTAGLLLLLAALFYLLSCKEVVVPEVPVKTSISLPSSFAQAGSSYEKIDSEWMALKYRSPKLQVPDLRNVLTFYGVNGRPDAPKETPLMHFGITGTKRVYAAKGGSPIYLDFDKTGNPPSFVFSKNNEKTSLWIEVQPQDSEARVLVSMEDEEGHLIAADLQTADFRLPAKELVRTTTPGRENWEIGKNRVDGTLMARQQARWYGVDRFMEKHGGDEFSFASGKHRIDFGEGEGIYSIFVDLNDCLVWDEDRWTVIQPGVDSLGKPLLHVKKVDERLMNFELWDESGQRKIPLTILRANEVFAKENLEKDFRFLGARTRSQCVFEVGNQRLLLKPNDWLLMTDEGWVKLESIEEIDGYVERRLVGPLFVFDGMVRRDERQVLLGTLFNSARTECETLELAIHHGGKPASFEVKQEPEEAQAYLHKGRDRCVE